MAGHPGIVFKDGPTGRRAALAMGPDVWEVVTYIKESQERATTWLSRQLPRLCAFLLPEFGRHSTTTRHTVTRLRRKWPKQSKHSGSPRLPRSRACDSSHDHSYAATTGSAHRVAGRFHCSLAIRRGMAGTRDHLRLRLEARWRRHRRHVVHSTTVCQPRRVQHHGRNDDCHMMNAATPTMTAIPPASGSAKRSTVAIVAIMSSQHDPTHQPP